MRSVPAFRSHILRHAALVVLLAGASASCSNSLRLGEEPAFTGSTENQREILGQNGGGADAQSGGGYSQPMPAPVSNGAVMSSDIPPPSSQQYAPSNDYASASPAPAPMADTTAPGTTFVWTAVGGRVVALKPGDTLDGLETRYGVPREQLLAANQMTSGAQIVPGKVVVIPRRVAVAPGETPPPAVASAMPEPKTRPAMVATSGYSYTVQPGDTMFSVARKNGTTVAMIAKLNGLEPTGALTTGQKLKVAGSTTSVATATSQKTVPTQLGAPPKSLGTLTMKSDATAQAQSWTVPAGSPKIRLASPADTAESGNQFAGNAPTANTQAMPTIPVTPQASDAPAVQNAAINPGDVAADAPSADGKQFRWPVRGRIISGFGTKPNGEKNDGINLAVPAGTSVKSVEAGTVIYAGNELAGYGNLVLIRHASGWVSAYAHNQDLLVKRGDTVQRGQTIAHAGMTGSVTSPQVHFELRMGAKPVNPLDYLAGA
jgi:murein DD-endopeptidase MepM/ murein hydrolase activator NlpD